MKHRVNACLFVLAAVGAAPVPSALAQTYTVGGAVYTDLANPPTSGRSGVTVAVEGDGGVFEGTTTWPTGVWLASEVPEGTYTVTPTLGGWCFKHVQSGVVGPPPPITIVVDAAHQAENLSIQFLASMECPVCGDQSCDAGEDPCSCPKDCYCGNGTCDPAEYVGNCPEDCDGSSDTGACCNSNRSCTDDMTDGDCVAAGGRYLGDGVACDADADGDGLIGCDDICPTARACGGIDAFGRPLGDVDNDCDVDLMDHAIIQLNFTGPFAPPGVVIDTVPVGHPGNAGELCGVGAGGAGLDRICGAVDYEYNIGKYEVTAGQYTAFLNAVADDDTYGLYNTNMWSDMYGCKIERTGLAPNYSYSVAPDWADRPVNYVSWGDAARFANWLHNGQPTGAQGPGTTENGSYVLDGAMSNPALMVVVRHPDATWVIPSEDEWYKAAYHKNDGVTGNYWDFPPSNDSVPSNDLAEPIDPGNNATFYDNGFTIDTPYYRTEGGAHENSDSPYDTFDQGGNVWELNEAILRDNYRGLRGGSFYGGVGGLLAASRGFSLDPASEGSFVGFRVAEVH